MLNGIFFLLFAFLVVFLSIKLSYYADNLSKTSFISKEVVGGILLAGVTSLPEFITCFSALVLDNPSLAVGDVLGSNLFNIFMICFFDLVFLSKMFTLKTNFNHCYVYLFLIINYIFIYLFVSNMFSYVFLSLGIPTIVIFVVYFFYIRFVSRNSNDDVDSSVPVIKNLKLKLIVCSILMVISSVLLTNCVNNISLSNPSFSSSLIGAILLGITTSLPEVITFYTLISLDNYDLGLSNIIGSNLFNLLVLGVGDLFLIGDTIFSYFDSDTFIILILGIIVTFISMVQNLRKRSFNRISYSLFSVVVVVLYISFWIIGFI